MLKPTKYLNLELSVISVSAEILKILRTNQLMKYDEVLSYLCETICDDVRYVFLPSINFLFLLAPDNINFCLMTEAFKCSLSQLLAFWTTDLPGQLDFGR